MIVVVSAIVDPWVTTFSFVVALAMRIQGQKLQILCRNQADFSRRNSDFKVGFMDALMEPDFLAKSERFA